MVKKALKRILKSQDSQHAYQSASSIKKARSEHHVLIEKVFTPYTVLLYLTFSVVYATWLLCTFEPVPRASISAQSTSFLQDEVDPMVEIRVLAESLYQE